VRQCAPTFRPRRALDARAVYAYLPIIPAGLLVVISRVSHMAKLIIIAIFLVTASAGVPAFAQNDNSLVAPEINKPAPGHLSNQDYLTSTGATVPQPGVPQASGPTPLDRAIEQQDNKIDNSICSGC
jgi:hypothetical protein